MNEFWIKMLTVAIKGLIGSVDWNKIFAAVEFYMISSLPGEQKRLAVIEVLKSEGLKAANFFRNLAIEIAVAKLNSK
jgi:hypothetical protein